MLDDQSKMPVDKKGFIETQIFGHVFVAYTLKEHSSKF